MKTNKNFAFMGFGKVVKTEEQQSFKRFSGCAPFKVVAVNPTKEELSAIYGTEITRDQVYLGTTEVDTPQGKKSVKQIRLDFILQTDPEEKETKDINLTTKLSLFISQSPKYTRDMAQVEAINDYGDTVYLTPAQLSGQEPIPENKKWFDPTGMRMALDGEGTLMAFLRAYLSLPMRSWTDRATKEVVVIDNPEEAKCGIANLKPIFTGNISAITSAILLAPNNKVRCLLGVKTDNGRQYQDVFNRKFNKYSNTRLDGIFDELNRSRQFGAYPKTDFVCKAGLHEVNIEATDFSTTTASSSVPTSSTELPDFISGGNNDDLPF